MTKRKDLNQKDFNSLIASYEEKVKELENSWKRALADYQNLQKRTLEEKDSMLSYVSYSLVSRILPIYSNLELIANHLNDDGINLVLKDFKNFLKEEGVSEVEVLGKDFDPSIMEAIEMVPGENGKVVEIIQKGYLLKSKIIRPARVKVGNGQKEDKNE